MMRKTAIVIRHLTCLQCRKFPVRWPGMFIMRLLPPSTPPNQAPFPLRLCTRKTRVFRFFFIECPLWPLIGTSGSANRLEKYPARYCAYACVRSPAQPPQNRLHFQQNAPIRPISHWPATAKSKKAGGALVCCDVSDRPGKKGNAHVSVRACIFGASGFEPGSG